MSLVNEFRATWSVDGGADQFGSWHAQELLAQVDLDGEEASAQPYTSFEGTIETHQVGV